MPAVSNFAKETSIAVSKAKELYSFQREILAAESPSEQFIITYRHLNEGETIFQNVHYGTRFTISTNGGSDMIRVLPRPGNGYIPGKGISIGEGGFVQQVFLHEGAHAITRDVPMPLLLREIVASTVQKGGFYPVWTLCSSLKSCTYDYRYTFGLRGLIYRGADKLLER